jgi:oligopeptide transport system permease protein
VSIRLFFIVLFAGDYTVIMGTTIFLATLIIVMNVLVDIVYKIIDPRIKLK